MRLWMVDPKIMCTKHLLGEHLECHMFVGSIVKKRNVEGFIANGLVEFHNLRKRHDALAKEIERRGMMHSSKLRPFKTKLRGKVDRKKSLKLLLSRCKKCGVKQ